MVFGIDTIAKFALTLPQGILDGTVKTGSEIRQGISDTIGNGRKGLIGVIKDAYTGVKSGSGTVLKKARDVTTSAPERIREKGTTALTALKEGAQYVGSGIKSLGEGGVAFTKNLAGSAKDLGINAAHLVSDGASKLGGAIGSTGRGIKENFNDLRPGQFSLNPRKAFSNAIYDTLHGVERTINNTINTTQEIAKTLLEGGPKLQPVRAK